MKLKFTELLKKSVRNYELLEKRDGVKMHSDPEKYIIRLEPEIITRLALAVFVAGFTPIPYKVATISAGAFKINFLTFTVASIVSRGCRFFIVDALIYFFGAKIKVFIDKYFNLLVIIFTILLIGGFLISKFMF